MLPRPNANAANLQRLRQQALARVLQEEQAPLVSRRWSLQRLGTLLAGATLLGTRAARAAGPRCPAPQYGAPGFYAATPTPPPHPEVESRADLALLGNWKESGAYLIAGNKALAMWGANTTIRTTYYQLPSGGILGLGLIDDKDNNFTYVVAANQTFYVAAADNLYGARFGNAELVLIPSFFKYRTPPDGDGPVLSAFTASVTDRNLTVDAAQEIHIPLTTGVPDSFWKPGKKDKNDNFGPRYPMIYSANISDSVLNLGLFSPYSGYGGYGAHFLIDLKSKRLTKFDGN